MIAQDVQRTRSIANAGNALYEQLIEENRTSEQQLAAFDQRVEEARNEVTKVKEPLIKLRLQMDMLLNINNKTLEKCQKYLHSMTDDNVTFILEHLIGLVQGVEKAPSKYVELYMKKVQGFIMAVNRINYKNVSITHCKNLLAELTGERAVAMGIAKKVGDNYEPTELDFPPHVRDFKIFYQILVQACKIAIAEQDAASVQRVIDEAERERNKFVLSQQANQRRLEVLLRVHSHFQVDQNL